MSDAITSLSFAIARNAPIGVIIAAWSGRLSRMYHWNLETDEIQPGQFLKGCASVEDISMDGRFVAYHAQTFHRRIESYIGISRVPYFTALAFFPVYPLSWYSVGFEPGKTLRIFIPPPSQFLPEESRRLLQHFRVDAGSPFKMQYDAASFEPRDDRHTDHVKKRLLRADASELTLFRVTQRGETPIFRFPKETFQEIKTPVWARVWKHAKDPDA